MSKMTITIEQDEFNEEGLYSAAATHCFEHDLSPDVAETWQDLLETFIRAVEAAGYIGVRESIKVKK